MKDKKINYSNEPRLTIRGRLGHIIALLGDGPIDDPIVSADRIGFADSSARDALHWAWLVVNDLQMALDDLNRKKFNARCLGEGETLSFEDLRQAESLIFSAICRIGRLGDEGEI